MRKYITRPFAFICLLFVIVGTSIYFSYKLFNENSEPESSDAENNIIKSHIMEVRKSDLQEMVNQNKIKPTTRMVYEYHYTDDDSVVRNYEMAPYFLIDLTEEELISKFIDWDILSFTSNEVVMRKFVEGRSEKYYVLGIKDGYVSVFYDNVINGSNLKEITNTLVSALPQEEQERLLHGIVIYGDENLMRALEDYGS